MSYTPKLMLALFFPGPQMQGILTPRTKTCPWGPRTWGTRLPIRLRGAVGVFDDVNIGQDDEALLNHLLDEGQKALDLFELCSSMTESRIEASVGRGAAACLC